MTQDAASRAAGFKVGDKVWYSPNIGGDFNPQVYTINFLGTLGHGEAVAWLEGKVGCVSLEALKAVEGV